MVQGRHPASKHGCTAMPLGNCAAQPPCPPLSLFEWLLPPAAQPSSSTCQPCLQVHPIPLSNMWHPLPAGLASLCQPRLTLHASCPPPGAPHPAVRHPRRLQAHAAAGPAPHHPHPGLGRDPALAALPNCERRAEVGVATVFLGRFAGGLGCDCCADYPCLVVQTALAWSGLPVVSPRHATASMPTRGCMSPGAGRRQGVPVLPAPAHAAGALR